MADVAIVADNGRIEESVLQQTLVAGEDLAQNDLVRIDSNGKFVKADASAAGTADVYGMVRRAVLSGFAVTAVRIGVMEGLDLSSLAYGAKLYLSDTAGRVGDAAGTVAVQVGRVIPVPGTTMGTAADKLALIHITA